MSYLQKFIVLALTIGLPFGAMCQKVASVDVDVDHPKAKIQPTMWGLFFEDINFAADGGLYAEMVKNRSFEFATQRMGWTIEQTSKDSSHFQVLSRIARNPQNPHYARVRLTDPAQKMSIKNEGFRGMGIKQGLNYYFSILASVPEGDVKMTVSLLSSTGAVVGKTTVSPSGKDWKKYEATLTSSVTDPKGRLQVTFEGKGLCDFDMVSLFPSDTWKGRKGGLRNDLVQLLYDMKPGFLRFPGGCIVEGRELALRYQWKKTVGNLEDRTVLVNKWNDGFSWKLTPDYYQSYGIGFFEYFQLAEDLGAEPLPVLSCGLACQFNTAEAVPLEDLEPYVQDALDLIEFANGSTSTKWGRLRADMGHPAPFNMKHIAVGNENWGNPYFERYAIFEKAIKSKYPDIKIISSTGPAPGDDLFKYAKEELKKYKADLVDEHYYNPPQWFLDNAARYDNYDRNSYKIFAGEYAAQSVATCSVDNKNNWNCAMSEAAYMTGLERNADVVYMCSYAPLFAHVDAWQWTPDLIWYDNLKSFGTANYYVQKLYANNKGTDLLVAAKEGKPLIGGEGLYASSVWDANTSEVILKVVNATDKPITQKFNLKSKKKAVGGKQLLLKGENLDALNSLDQPTKVSPVEQTVEIKGNQPSLTIPAQSLSVFRIKMK